MQLHTNKHPGVHWQLQRARLCTMLVSSLQRLPHHHQPPAPTLCHSPQLKRRKTPACPSTVKGSHGTAISSETSTFRLLSRAHLEVTNTAPRSSLRGMTTLRSSLMAHSDLRCPHHSHHSSWFRTTMRRNLDPLTTSNRRMTNSSFYQKMLLIRSLARSSEALLLSVLTSQALKTSHGFAIGIIPSWKVSSIPAKRPLQDLPRRPPPIHIRRPSRARRHPLRLPRVIQTAIPRILIPGRRRLHGLSPATHRPRQPLPR